MTIVNSGKQIGIVSIKKNKQGSIVIKNPKMISLSNTIESDPIISNMILRHYKKIKVQQQKQKELKILEQEKKILELTPEEFIKQYNNERKK